MVVMVVVVAVVDYSSSFVVLVVVVVLGVSLEIAGCHNANKKELAQRQTLE
jgi:hypothetical protein